MDLIDFEEVNESNKEIVFSKIEDLLYIYLYEGNVSPTNISIENLFGLTSSELKTLKTVHFLFSDEVKRLIDSLPNLMRNLAHSTKKESATVRGNIRGKIEWDKTLKVRYDRGFNDKSLFVCAPPSKYYDLEENQLLKFILKKLIQLTKNNLIIVKKDSEIDLDKLDIDNWQHIIRHRVNESRKTLNKVYFNEIQDIKPKNKHVRKCFKNRNRLYNHVAEVYSLYEKLFILNDKCVIADFISKHLIKTADVHKLYELYIFFSLVRGLDENKQLKLIYSGNSNSIHCSKEDYNVILHYQKTPSIFSRYSMYKKIVDNLDGIEVNVRSPDIIIEFKQGNVSFYRIIEVKNSSEEGYIRKSIYKVMGYYQDFKSIEDHENSQLCKLYPVVLVTYHGISLKKDYDPFIDKEIIILNREEFLDSLNELLILN